MEINGVAHIVLTVCDMKISGAFYRPLLAHLGMRAVVDQPDYLYYVGGRTALGLRPAAESLREQGFVQQSCGLHHLCLRARSREDVESVHDLLVTLGANIIHPPREEGWVPGYYSILFEDPDGIRLEVNYVPGRGIFEQGVERKAQVEPR